jgi:predicted MFS family arabinose efflux permease
VFLVAGAAMAAWAPLVPFAKANANVDNSVLGLVLLCLGGGSLITMPLAGRLVARYGCRVVILASALLACAMLPLLTVASSPVLLAVSLLLFGAGIGAMDVSMNLQAIVVERDAGRAMMSGFHAMFSLGGILGALAMSGALAAGMSPTFASSVIVAALVIACIASASHLITQRSAHPGPMFGIPRGIVLLIGALAASCFLMEGAVLDWSAIYLSSIRGLDVSRAGIGYAAFSAAMVLGRSTGDRVVERFGRRTTLTTGAACAAFGVALVVSMPDWRASVVGFMVIGLGCSNVVPILFTAAGRQTVMPESLAVPAVTTMGYAGLLAGPAAIGLIAGQVGLTIAFALLAVMMSAAALLGRRLPR